MMPIGRRPGAVAGVLALTSAGRAAVSMPKATTRLAAGRVTRAALVNAREPTARPMRSESPSTTSGCRP
jgi:hypothetical protein